MFLCLTISWVSWTVAMCGQILSLPTVNTTPLSSSLHNTLPTSPHWPKSNWCTPSSSNRKQHEPTNSCMKWRDRTSTTKRHSEPTSIKWPHANTRRWCTHRRQKMRERFINNTKHPATYQKNWLIGPLLGDLDQRLQEPFEPDLIELCVCEFILEQKHRDHRI